MRIIAGTARGRRLLAAKSAAIRPTADRVRESIFNVLGQTLDGEDVLDLFAGTGALALEALSRGALSAVLVDRDSAAIRLCKANAEALGFEDRTRIIATPVARALKLLQREGARFDLIFADPPYAARAVLETVGEIEAATLCKPGGRVCIEHDKRESAPESVGVLSRVDQRRFGDTFVSIYRSP
jgi:16S rRNA (guanine(966)-N(2))-methyltransferase RsmD